MRKKLNFPALLIALMVFCFLLYYPIFNDHTAQKAFALLVMVAILWVSEAIPLPLTGLLIPVLAILMQLATPKIAFAEFANPIIFLFMGGFVLAGALSHHGLDKRLAKMLIKIAKSNFYWSAILLMLATSLTACWVSNTSSVAMMIPLGLGMLALVKRNTVTSESKFLMLGIAYAANIGGVITMVATPPNAMGAALLGLSFSEWIIYGLPMFLVTFPIMIVILTLYFKPDRKLSIGDLIIETNDNTPTKTLTTIFLITIILWTMDGQIAPMLGVSEGFNSLAAIFAIFLVFITKILSWEEIRKSIHWDVLLLFGGGLTLGILIDSSGLGAILVGQISHLTSAVPLFIFIWIIVLFSIVLTEFMSNTASAALILPLLFTMAGQLQINPMILVFPATIAASYGFMMPVGTPPNAMVFSSGLIPQKDMMKAGLSLNILFSIILTTFFYLIFR